MHTAGSEDNLLFMQLVLEVAIRREDNWGTPHFPRVVLCSYDPSDL